MATASPQSAPDQGRRSFLKKGVLGGVLLAIGGVGLLASRRTRPIPLPSEGLLVLDWREYAILMSVASRLLPAGEGFPSASQVGVGVHADRALSLAEPNAAKEVKQLLRLFDNALAGFLFGGRVRPFTSLPSEEQDEVLAEWQSSRLQLRRTGFQALRTLAIASYFAAPLSWPAVHYPGPPQGFHQPEAPAWRGGGQKRPDGNGVFHPETSRD